MTDPQPNRPRPRPILDFRPWVAAALTALTLATYDHVARPAPHPTAQRPPPTLPAVAPFPPATTAHTYGWDLSGKPLDRPRPATTDPLTIAVTQRWDAAMALRHEVHP